MTATTVTFTDTMTEKGWALAQMGGGCEQYVQIIDADSGTEYRLTDGDFGPPIAMDEPCVLICEEHHGEFGGYIRNFPSVAACLEWLDTAEYVLPWNGDGAEANGWTVICE